MADRREARRGGRARWRDRRPGHPDAGFTLVEMLVGMAVFGLALTLLTRAVVEVQGYTGTVQGSADAVSEVRLALADLDRQVRSGNVLYSPANEPSVLAGCTASGTSAGSCMRVYTQSNGLDRCVQWQVLADPARPGTSLLRKRSWSPSWQTDHDTTGWGVMARGLRASPTVPPFTLQTSGAAAAYGSRLLDVRFEAVDPNEPTREVVIASSVSGRNTSYGYDGGLCSLVPPA